MKKIINFVLSRLVWTYRRKVRKTFINIRVRLLAKNVKEFKDLYKGKSCFILGNGPSLSIEDLT